jgi:hypothetical protein
MKCQSNLNNLSKILKFESNSNNLDQILKLRSNSNNFAKIIKLKSNSNNFGKIPCQIVICHARGIENSQMTSFLKVDGKDAQPVWHIGEMIPRLHSSTLHGTKPPQLPYQTTFLLCLTVGTLCPK